jgi:hypothetical protein
MQAVLLMHFFGEGGGGFKTNESCRGRSIIFVGGRDSRRNMSPVSHLSSPLQLMNLGYQKLDSATWSDHEPLYLFVTRIFNNRFHTCFSKNKPARTAQTFMWREQLQEPLHLGNIKFNTQSEKIYKCTHNLSVALRPNAGHGLLILEVSRSHITTHHSR